MLNRFQQQSKQLSQYLGTFPSTTQTRPGYGIDIFSTGFISRANADTELPHSILNSASILGSSPYTFQ
ncbi:hypothetical protein GYMLUDRAFT_47168 [Collybiopsis luxurians FD-317 M1]|uniref:Uncharacterized protein n=1 Tax=Collybiopsis luxurians FD-317 M1 TaxID=944289 RepID=A0A0D0C267_9AGAR|nr:hypothetical protein GYMLUDRAFT_47168 [Collybiopsis luxurians FD-317 M1]